MDLRGKKVFVSGAGGFIGSHLTERLLDLGCEVNAFLRYSSKGDLGFLSNIKNKNLNIIHGDLRDDLSVKEAIDGNEIVFHLGAMIAIPYSYVNPLDAFETNVKGTINVLRAVKDCSVSKMIHTSTSETYGTAKYVPIDEKHPLQGQSPYSASKISADKFVESFYNSYDTPVAIIRPFNTYGPRQSARAVIPTIITQALVKNKITLGSLHPTRDFTYVKDTVNGFIQVAKSNKSIGQVINVGSNEEISIEKLVNMICDLLGKKIKVETSSDRIRPSKSEVDRLLANTSKAKQLFDWKTEYNLRSGLSETIEWIKSNLSLYDTENYNI